MEEIPASEFDSQRSFDAKEVVQRYRKRVPLPQLQRSLRAHHAATRQELVELINEKYADFVSLSSRMQGVERALKPLRAPLEESSELTRGLHTKLGAILGQAEDTQKELARVRARKDALTAYIENAKILNRAREALTQRWGNPQESDDFLREHVEQENIARDLRRIRLNLGGRLQAGSPPAAGASGGQHQQAKPPPPPVTSGGAAAGDGGGGGAGDGSGGTSLVEEASPECQALLKEAATFEETFAEGLRERLHGLVAAAKRGWEEPSATSQDQSVDAGGAGGPPARAELLAVAHLCRALVTVGRAHVVEATFADVFVKASLEAATAACSAAAEEARRQALSAAEGLGSGGVGALSIGAGAVDLGPFFRAVQEKLLVEGSPLLWFAQRLRGGVGGSPTSLPATSPGADVESALLSVPSLRLVSNAVAGPVLKHVQQVWPNVFMPAFPDVFAANYVHATKFIQAVEGFMTQSERQAFAQSASLTDFRRRWKTQVYFSLRQKEAVQRLQAVVAKPTALVPAAERLSAAGGEVWLEASAELLRLLETMWNGWYLEVLYPKMVQLSLELLAKYGKLVSGLAEAPEASATIASGWDTTASPPVWAPTSLPMRWSRVAVDMLQMISALGTADATGWPGSLARLFLSRLPESATSADGGASGKRPGELVRALLDEAIKVLRPALADLEGAMLRQVTVAVTPQFGAIRTIPALYRMLNKPVPTKPSPYVEAALRPILALREATQSIASADAVASWVRKAVDAAALEFSVQATQLLDSTKQQEASLRRLGGRSSGGEAQVSDLDKIHIQLCLDVETFTTAASDMGALAEGGSGLAKLAEAVSPVRPTYEAHRAPAPGAA